MREVYVKDDATAPVAAEVLEDNTSPFFACAEFE